MPFPRPGPRPWKKTGPSSWLRPMPSQIMTFGPPHALCSMTQLSWKGSPLLRHTLTRPSALLTQNQLSSVNTTVRHCLQFQLVWFLAHCRRARRCLRVRTSTRARRQFRRSRAQRLRRTVSLLIGTWWRPMVHWAVSEAVRKRSLWWLRKILRSCLGVVTQGLPLLGRSSVTHLAAKRCCRQQTVVKWTLNDAATLWGSSPAVKRPIARSRCAAVSLGMVAVSKTLVTASVQWLPFIANEPHTCNSTPALLSSCTSCTCRSWAFCAFGDICIPRAHAK